VITLGKERKREKTNGGGEGGGSVPAPFITGYKKDGIKKAPENAHQNHLWKKWKGADRGEGTRDLKGQKNVFQMATPTKGKEEERMTLKTQGGCDGYPYIGSEEGGCCKVDDRV